jgi:hypothetical protein
MNLMPLVSQRENDSKNILKTVGRMIFPFEMYH